MSGDWVKREQNSLSIIFSVYADDTQEIDAKPIINSLGAITNIIQKGNTLLNGEKTEAFVKIRGSPKAGSVVIEIVTLISSGGFLALINVSTVFLDLLTLYLSLKGRKVSDVTTSYNGNGNIVYNLRIEGDVNITLPQETYTVVKDPSINKNVEKLGKQLSDGGLDRIVIQANDMETHSVEIHQDDARYFKNPFPCDISTTVETMILEISRLSLKGEEKGWKFSTGDKSFDAEMKDKTFHKRILEKNLSVSHGDFIKAEVETRYNYTSAGAPKKVVTKVLSYNGTYIGHGKSGVQITFEDLIEAADDD